MGLHACGFIDFDEIDSESHVNENDVRREHEEIRRCFVQYCQQNPVLPCKPDSLDERYCCRLFD